MAPPAGEPEAKSEESSRLTSRSVLLWSGGGIALLALVALVCWLVLGPFFQVRAALAYRRQMVSSDPEVNEKVLVRLGGPRQAVRKLSIYLHVPERWAADKESALWQLGAIGHEAAGAIDAVAELLGTPDTPGQPSGVNNPGTTLRRSSAWALGSIGPAAARCAPDLEAALGDQDPDVRINATQALTRVHPRDSLEPWVRLLSDQDSHCRNSAAYELGKMGSAAKSALPALAQRLAIENQAQDKSGERFQPWTPIGSLRSAIWKISTEPDPAPRANREVRAKLENRWSFIFAQVPFAEALQRTADAGGFKVVTSPSLAGTDPRGNVPTITLRIAPGDYNLALEWICKLRDCDWTVKDGAVYVFDDKELK